MFTIWWLNLDFKHVYYMLAKFKCSIVFRFPNDDVLRQRWQSSLSKYKIRSSCKQYICFDHFKEKDFKTSKQHKKLLRRLAVPSVFEYAIQLSDYSSTSAVLSSTSSTSCAVVPQKDEGCSYCKALRIGNLSNTI